MASEKEKEVALFESLPSCPHVGETKPLPNGQLNVNADCENCPQSADSQEKFVCLTCYKIFCEEGDNHRQNHHHNSQHPLYLSLTTFVATCIPCEEVISADSNENIMEAIGAAVRSKFGVIYELPSLDNYFEDP